MSGNGRHRDSSKPWSRVSEGSMRNPQRKPLEESTMEHPGTYQVCMINHCLLNVDPSGAPRTGPSWPHQTADPMASRLAYCNYRLPMESGKLNFLCTSQKRVVHRCGKTQDNWPFRWSAAQRDFAIRRSPTSTDHCNNHNFNSSGNNTPLAHV